MAPLTRRSGAAHNVGRGESVYSFAEAARILRVRRSRLHYWDRTGLLCPSRQNAAGRRRYDFCDLVELRALLGLLDAGASLQQVRRGLARSSAANAEGAANADGAANAEGAVNARGAANAHETSNAEAAEEGGGVVVEGGALRALTPAPAAPGGRTRVLLAPGGVLQEVSGQLCFDFAAPQAAAAPCAALALPLPVEAHAPAPETPQTAFGWFERGFALADAPGGDVQGALDAYGRALELDPDFADAHLQRGILLHAVPGELPAAEAAYRRALEAEPQHAEAGYHLANLLEETGRGAEALRCFEAALCSDPDFADAWLGLALLCEAQQKGARARRAWQGYLRCTGSGHWAAIARKRLGPSGRA